VGFINVIAQPTESYKSYLSDKARNESIKIYTAKAHIKKGSINVTACPTTGRHIDLTTTH
jgi:hypothetical protein